MLRLVEAFTFLNESFEKLLQLLLQLLNAKLTTLIFYRRLFFVMRSDAILRCVKEVVIKLAAANITLKCCLQK